MLQRILRIFRPKVQIPDYNDKRPVLDHYRKMFDIKILVETGTFMGDTVEYFKKDFDFIYSIELSEDLANKAKNRFKGDSNVKIIQGDSGDVLSDLIGSLKQSALFWLDGHYSSEFFVNGEFIKTARSEKDTPIEKELQTLIDSPIRHVILIDDARLFVGQGDYPTIDQIKAIIRKSPHKYTVDVKTDIICIIPE